MTERVKIKCDDCKFEPECADYGWLGCKKFTPAPSEPQTNEEWRKTCSTEEFAEFLSDVVFNAIVDYRIDKNNCEKEDGNYWLKWLKRSHKRKDDD